MIERIEENENVGGTPDVVELHLLETRLDPLDLADEFFNIGFYFGHLCLTIHGKFIHQPRHQTFSGNTKEKG